MRIFADFRAEREMIGLRRQAELWVEALAESVSDDPALWITPVSEEALMKRLAELEAADGAEDLPLYGLPFAVKDNIDVAGLPTTAACPAFTYVAERDAPVVAALLRAGALCLGKTNLDQFATGLVGVRSPYGVPRNPLGEGLIPGGSSSGSAVAVARGLAAFSLGTDTAGSGRVPAAMCGIWGWKPTRGLVSARGVVPACRSLDCVSVFATSAGDLAEVASVVAGFDPGDPWARAECVEAARPIRRVAVPPEEEMEFFGDAEQESAWARAVGELRSRGMEVVRFSLAPFFEAARLLYGGPWVAERYLVAREILEKNPEALHPVTRGILEGGASGSAADAFAAHYRLAELRRAGEAVWGVADAIALPTIGHMYRIEEIEADPLRTNSNLGFYTNFFNLCDLCGLAMPWGTRGDGLPFGITLGAPAWRDASLLGFAGAEWDGGPRKEPAMELVVFGAHMRGLPLEGRLRAMGGRFLREERTKPCYRMVALDALRPGVFRVAEGGGAIECEVWELPRRAFGELLAEIPAPLGLGKVRLEDGSEVCGFVCEAAAAQGKPDITHCGGWRARFGASGES